MYIAKTIGTNQTSGNKAPLKKLFIFPFSFISAKRLAKNIIKANFASSDG